MEGEPFNTKLEKLVGNAASHPSSQLIVPARKHNYNILTRKLGYCRDGM
jgi:hypothetical protein